MVHIDIFEEVLIIAHPTGIVYENQCDGHACSRRHCEGFVFPLAWLDCGEKCVDDCKVIGCHFGSFYPNDTDDRKSEKINHLLKCADIINEIFLYKCSRIWNTTLTIEIDKDRIEELVEAWWPVKGKIGNGVYEGYIATDNCD